MSCVRRILTVSMTAVCLSGFLAVTTYGQSLPPSKDQDQTSDENWNTFGAESGPKLQVGIDKIELGVITDNQKVKRVIPFKNVGTGLLTIEKVNTSCGCTAADLEVKDYLPGESGEVQITYDPTGRKGKQRKIITIISNDRDNRLTQVVLTVDIKPIIDVDKAIITAGNVIYGQGAEVRAVFSCDWKHFKPKSVEIVGASVSAAIEKSEEIKLPDGRINHRVTVLVNIDKDAPIGYVRRILNFTAEVGNGDEPPFEQQATARVNVNVVGDIMATPSRLSMGRLIAGSEFDRQITLISRTNTPFEITKVEFSRPIAGKAELSFEKETNENGKVVYKVHVKGVAPMQPGIINGAVRISTNIKEQPEITVSLIGSITRPRR